MGSSSNPKVSLIPFPYAYTSGSVTVNNQVAGGNNSPIGFPTYYADFTQSLPSELTQTSRGSNATMYDSQGRLVFAPANMLSYSEQFDNAFWTKNSITVSPDAAVAPNGVMSADLCYPASSGVNRSIIKNLALGVSGQQYTVSVYAKAAGINFICFADVTNSVNSVWFNLSTGTNSTPILGTASIVSVGNGWYRCSLTTAANSASLYTYIEITDSSGSSTVTVAGTNGVLLWGMQVEPYDVSSPKTYIPTTSAAYYGNRFDTDPFTLQPLGLLLEEERTNLLQSSANLSGSPWSGSNATTVATAYGVLGPDGLTCQSCTENSTSAYIKQTMPIASPTTDFICCSGYFKYGSGGSFIVLQIDDPTGSHGVRCWFDIVNGLVKSSTTFGTGTYSGASIQPLTNGWFRCTLTAKLGASGSSPARMFNWCAPADGNTVSANGSLSYRYGLQIESGAATSFATSYIPTYGTSTATRSADNTPYMSATGIYNYLGGTAVCEYSQPNIPSGGSPTSWCFSSGSAANRMIAYGSVGGATEQPSFLVDVSSANVFTGSTTGNSNNTAVRLACAWAASDFYVYDSKGGSVSAAAGTPPGNGVITTLSFGLNNGIGAVAYARWIKSFAYYNSRLSNAQVQALATVARPPILNLDLTSQDTRLNWGTSDRGTNATQYDSLGRLVWAPANMLLYSEQLDATAWINSAATITANAALSPIGTLSADKLAEDSTTATHSTRPSGTVTVGYTYTASVYAKAVERTWIAISMYGLANGIAWFDLTNGAVGTIQSAIAAANIQSVGGGWYRCSVTYTATATSMVPTLYVVLDNNSLTYAGTAGNGLYVWGAQLEPTGIDSPKSYVPTLVSAVYKPRFDYDPATLTALGFLMEEQRTNLATYSDQFDNGAWNTANASISPDVVTSPAGLQSADKMVEDSATASHRIRCALVSLTQNSVYSFSVYVKAAGRTWVALSNTNSGNWSGGNPIAYFDIQNGAVGNVGANCTASISSVGNGWYRCTLTATFTAVSTTGQSDVYISNSNGSLTYTGNGSFGVYLWGAQLEAGAFATSYIPTYAAAATRNADPAPFLPVGSWYYQGGGTLKAQYRMAGKNTSSAQGVVAISDGTINNNWQVYNRWVSGSTNASSMLVVTGAVNQAYFDVVSSLSAGVDYKIVAQATANSFKSTQTGATIQSDLSGTMPTGMTQLVIGSIYTYASSYPANGWIKSVSYNLKFDFSDGQLVESTIL